MDDNSGGPGQSVCTVPAGLHRTEQARALLCVFKRPLPPSPFLTCSCFRSSGIDIFCLTLSINDF